MITQADMNKILQNVNDVLRRYNDRIEVLEQALIEAKKPTKTTAKKTEEAA